MPDSVSFQNTGLPDIVELKSISQTYPDSDKKIFENLNLLIEDKPNRAQFVSILGKSGCGKSTVLRYIAGLQKPTTGEVLIHGKPLEKNNVVGMVFQKYSSFPWLTTWQNIELGLKIKGIPKKERDEKIKEIIALVELEGTEDRYAKSPNLSGGQLQRVAIARSLLACEEILLMDEPFGALDISTRLKMQDLLLKIWNGLGNKNSAATIIFVTHDISEAVYLSDEILIMKPNPGRVVKKIDNPIPYEERKHAIKRSKQFVDMVYEIEDFMQKKD